MKNDAASLDNLRDIVELAPVSWWPLAAGWWFVIGLSAVGILAFILRTWRNWQANSYRRAAMKELQASTKVVEVADILKRTALCAYPRNQVASLSGAKWCHWLSETAGQAVSDTVARCLTTAIYSKTHSVDQKELVRFAEQWVKNHRTEHFQTVGKTTCRAVKPGQQA